LIGWQEAQRSLSALVARGRKPADGPRCWRCTQSLLGLQEHAEASGGRPRPAPRKPRVARAKVSAASKGVIPVTLGGKLPPVSVLSRREFGLRALRR
jgi:hypothetical protein